MKVQTAILAAALMAAGSGAAHAAAPEPEMKSWIVGIRAGSAAEPARSMRTRPTRRFQSVDAYAVQMTEREAASLRGTGGVRYVEPDYERHLLAIPAGPRRTSDRPATIAPLASARSASQVVPYGVDLVRARDVWSHGRGAGIRVAVVDTGVDYTHPELKKIYKGGKDLINGDDDPMDDHGHGTHVAGTIAAADDLFGVVGIAPEIELYGIKILDRNGKGSKISDMMTALDWAIDHDIDVVNLSLGGAESSIAEAEAFQRAFDFGVLAIAASGNDYEGVDGIMYPAAYPTVIAVGAIDEKQIVAGFSQRGTGLALVAPGVAVTSTLPVGSGIIADVAVDGKFLPEVGTPEGSPNGDITAGFVACGLGKTGEFPAAVRGKIALIKRGEITFNEKARNAIAAGATGVIIYNHENSPLHWTLIRNDALGKPISDALPVTAAISMTEGEDLLKKPTATVNLVVSPYDYGTLQGTSMATPHVAGVAALVWSLAPNASAAQVREAITGSGRDLGAGGWDTTYGYGVVDAVRAARSLAPQVFGVPPRHRTAGR